MLVAVTKSSKKKEEGRRNKQTDDCRLAARQKQVRIKSLRSRSLISSPHTLADFTADYTRQCPQLVQTGADFARQGILGKIGQRKIAVCPQP